MSESYHGAEKRAARRQISKFTIRYRLSDKKDSILNTAVTYDISAGGFSFVAPQQLAIDALLDCEVSLPQVPDLIKAKGVVRRILKEDDSQSYVYGVAFKEIDESERAVIQQYIQEMSLNNILRAAVKLHASDIHLVANQPPILRVSGELIKTSDLPIPASELKEMIRNMLSKKQGLTFEEDLELDFAYSMEDGGRFRVNVHQEKGNIEATFRHLQTKVRTLEELGIPAVAAELARKKSGLILVTGPVGSGKTTTLAAMIDLINSEKNSMIVSIEDPIEYVYESKKSVIKQREVGIDTHSFAAALKHVLRQDPNVILVGEMRDLDSISMAITAAETGHLILSTLHTADAVETINRVIDVYPAEKQTQIRSQLASCLQGIIAQLLIPDISGKGMVLATEVLVATPAVRNLIRNGNLNQIQGYIETGSSSDMQSMDSAIISLARAGKISNETGAAFIKDKMKLRELGSSEAPPEGASY